MTAPVNAGDVLAGKYRVDRVLGMGGMGVVVAATHVHLDQRVALKFLLPELTSNTDVVARFAREARAAVKIQSEHVARVLDVGTLDTGAPYMVMEYLEGSDLADVLQSRGPLSWQETVDYVLQACEAIAEAHLAGIVHRDLKPANLFLIRRADGSPCVKVLDFGISKAATQDAGAGAGLTHTSAVMGSPKYMSPEQLKSTRDVDARTDIWAIGVILYELLSGEGAFKADTMPQLYVSILQDPPQQLRRNDVPPTLSHVILRCLEKEPARRFQSVAELATALSDIAPPQSRVSVERITRILNQGRQETSNPSLSSSSPQGYAPSAPQGFQQGPPAPVQGYSPTLAVPNYPQHGYPSSPAPGYGAQPGYPSPTQPGMGHPLSLPHPQQAPPPGYPSYTNPTSYPQPGGPPREQPQRMHPAVVVVITIGVILALSMGGCMVCVCVGAASN